MNKETILLRLSETIKKLEKLNPPNFTYDRYINVPKEIEDEILKGKEANDIISSDKIFCETTACVAGHYPQWFPQAELAYAAQHRIDYDYEQLHTFPLCITLVSTNKEFNEKYPILFSIKATLSEYHGLNIDIINFLFYGSSNTLYLTEKGLQEMDSIYQMWHNSSIILCLIEHTHKSLYTKIHGGIKASLFHVMQSFKFIEYMISNDFISDYQAYF